MILETRIQHWPDEAACAVSAAALASHAGLGAAFIELHGPLGAGKTTFVRYLLQALGVQGTVKSPTYAVLESYEVAARRGDAAAANRGAGSSAPGRLPIHHFDFYRFDDPQEWEDAGFRDVFSGPGLKLAEWPEKASGFLPLADLQIFIDPLDDATAGLVDSHGAARDVRFVANTSLGLELLHNPAAVPSR